MSERFDVRGSDLATLVVCCLDNGGKVSKNRRRQFAGRVPEAAFDHIERVASELPVPGEEGIRPEPLDHNNSNGPSGPG